jgi:hypothetical protein
MLSCMLLVNRACEAIYDHHVRPFRHLYQVDEIDAPIWGYQLDNYGMDIAMIFVLGTAYRVIAFILMIALHRDKQR